LQPARATRTGRRGRRYFKAGGHVGTGVKFLLNRRALPPPIRSCRKRVCGADVGDEAVGREKRSDEGRKKRDQKMRGLCAANALRN